MRYIQQLYTDTPQSVVVFVKKKYVYYIINEPQISLKTKLKCCMIPTVRNI